MGELLYVTTGMDLDFLSLYENIASSLYHWFIAIFTQNYLVECYSSPVNPAVPCVCAGMAALLPVGMHASTPFFHTSACRGGITLSRVRQC